MKFLNSLVCWQRRWKLNEGKLFPIYSIYYFKYTCPKKRRKKKEKLNPKTKQSIKPKTGKRVRKTLASNADTNNSSGIDFGQYLLKLHIIWIAENQESFPCHCPNSYNTGTEGLFFLLETWSRFMYMLITQWIFSISVRCCLNHSHIIIYNK